MRSYCWNERLKKTYIFLLKLSFCQYLWIYIYISWHFDYIYNHIYTYDDAVVIGNNKEKLQSLLNCF